MILKGRLASIAKLVPFKTTVADIGTDHAYLPVYLIKEGQVQGAVAGDVHTGPYERACLTVKQYGLLDRISVRLGNGLTVLTPGEVETVILAGMGGPTMIDIFEAEPKVTTELSFLVLQPMIGADKLRVWLRENKWQIADEELVFDEDRLYQVILASRDTKVEPMKVRDQWDQIVLDHIGPRLWQKKHALLTKHMTDLVKQQQKLIQSLKQSESCEAQEKRVFCEALLNRLEEWQKWL